MQRSIARNFEGQKQNLLLFVIPEHDNWLYVFFPRIILIDITTGEPSGDLVNEPMKNEYVAGRDVLICSCY